MSLFSKFFNSKKSENTVDEVGAIFFDAAYGLAKAMISKERNELKNLGFNKFKNHTFIKTDITLRYFICWNKFSTNKS